MNTHSKAVKCRKRDSLKPFLGKIIQKTTFLKLFSCYEKRLHSPFLPLHRQNKDSESRRHITKLAWVFC